MVAKICADGNKNWKKRAKSSFSEPVVVDLDLSTDENIQATTSKTIPTQTRGNKVQDNIAIQLIFLDSTPPQFFSLCPQLVKLGH